MYQLEAVTKIYACRGEQVAALRIESLEIAAGTYLAIIGASGSGKTTLLSTLGGMLSPTTGKVRLQGTSVYDLPVGELARLRRQRIGFVFQTFHLVPYLTALENVQIPLCLNGISRHEQTELATRLLARVGLEGRTSHKPSELSVGQQQRVALARTMANAPSVILADEPTGNLDPESRRLVLDFLDESHRDGCTVIMVTHDPVAAERAQRRLSLDQGAVVTGKTAALVPAA